MALTSPALAVILAIATAALLGALLWWWPKLAGPGLRPVLLRVAALCAVQLSVISLIFVVVNRSAVFYSSWSDLLGTDNAAGAVTAGRYSSARLAAPVTVTASRPVAVAGRHKARGGLLQTVRLYGQLSGLTAPAYVYLPAGYAKASATAGRLPVVVVISDEVSSQAAPDSAPRLAAAAAAQMAARRLRPLILVMLPAGFGRGDQGCLNVPGSTQAATFFAQDLPEVMHSAYHAGRLPSQWGLIGDSSGGYCALQLVMTNSDAFSAAAVPPAAYTSPPGSGEFGGSPQIQTQDNLSWLLRHQPMQPVSVLFAGIGLSRAQPFMSLARPPMHVAGLQGSGTPLSSLDWIGRTLSRNSSSGS